MRDRCIKPPLKNNKQIDSETFKSISYTYSYQSLKNEI